MQLTPLLIFGLCLFKKMFFLGQISFQLFKRGSKCFNFKILARSGSSWAGWLPRSSSRSPIRLGGSSGFGRGLAAFSLSVVANSFGRLSGVAWSALFFRGGSKWCKNSSAFQAPGISRRGASLSRSQARCCKNSARRAHRLPLAVVPPG